MLEEIKAVLINEKQEELKQRQQIDKEIKELIKKRDSKQNQAVQELSKLELDMKKLNSKSFSKIFHGKEIKELCEKYANISNSAIGEIKSLNSKIDDLYQTIHDLSHDEAKIEKEIEKIKQAGSLQELGLTQKAALQYLKNDDKKVIRAVFKEIKDNEELETSSDINRNMSALYQTNLSPFVVAMQKISLDVLVEELIDIGIIIDEDKVRFLKNLTEHGKSPNNTPFQIHSEQVRTDRLDNNFYNQVEVDLANMNRYSSYPPLAISKIATLAVLVSIAKANKKEKQTQK